ncbi:MAG: M14 family metallopeptidase [Erythrobacter sp.]|nr:M14 family metallopeptidase [Erythrobacter sp.]
MTTLTILDAVPAGLLDCEARNLHALLGSPTLIELPGRSGAPLFVSALIHGNEDSGLGAIQRVLRRFAGAPLPRPLMLLIGNVEAAREGRRKLPGQPDFNRIWPGAESDIDSPEARTMAEVHRRVIEREAFAAIDIHNNTGRNPHYAVLCVKDARVMGLSSMFAPKGVLFRGLPGTQTASFSGSIPAITIECGQPGREENAQAAGRFLESVLTLAELPSGGVRGDEFELFHTLVQVRVKSEIDFSDDQNRSWLRLEGGLDRLNFEPIDGGTLIGRTNHPMPLEAIDEGGRDLASAFFSVDGGELRLTRSAIPAMLTTDERIIRQDCLCYLMERLQVERS